MCPPCVGGRGLPSFLQDFAKHTVVTGWAVPGTLRVRDIDLKDHLKGRCVGYAPHSKHSVARSDENKNFVGEKHILSYTHKWHERNNEWICGVFSTHHLTCSRPYVRGRQHRGRGTEVQVQVEWR